MTGRIHGCCRLYLICLQAFLLCCPFIQQYSSRSRKLRDIPTFIGHTGCFFLLFRPKNDYKEKLNYQNCSANCSSQKILSIRKNKVSEDNAVFISFKSSRSTCTALGQPVHEISTTEINHQRSYLNFFLDHFGRGTVRNSSGTLTFFILSR